MQSILIKKCNIRGVEVEIRLSKDQEERDPELITKFMYELVNFND